MRTETLSSASIAAPINIRRFMDMIDRWLERAAGRRQLSHMTEAQLKDIGITRCDALRELDKPFWRA